MSPNIDLLDHLVRQRILPTLEIVDQFLSARYKIAYPCLRFLLRKPFSKIKNRYLTGKQTGKMFSKYKSYRLIVLEQDPNRHG